MKLIAVALLSALASGCAVHVQGPVKEVAYDFSDAAYYDKDFAPSPRYEQQALDDGSQYADPVSYVADASEPAPAEPLPEPAPELMIEPGGQPVVIDPANLP